jgi:hypothetical protein
LPALAYAAWYKSPFGALIMLVGLYLTGSLGGYIGLAMLAIVLVYVRMSQRQFTLPALIFSAVLAATIWLSFGDTTKDAYLRRGASHTVREDNLQRTVVNLPMLLLDFPLGFNLTRDVSAEDRRYQLGTNFTVGNALQFGGIAAFVGYIGCVLVSLVCASRAIIARQLSARQKVVFCSLIVLFPFIAQRAVIWDSALFALLFAQDLIELLRPSPKPVEA